MRTTPLVLAYLLTAACGSSTPTKPTTTTAGDLAAGSGAGPKDPADVTPATGPTAALVTKQLGAETAITTAWSAVITVPASWRVARTDQILRVEDPEQELQVSFTSVKVASADDAMATAWNRIQPGFSLAPANVQTIPGREGWDEIVQRVYVTKAEESRLVVAVGERKGDTWYVTTIDGKTAAIGRRGAQLNAMLTDMKVPGVDKESFAGKPAQLGDAELAKISAFVEEARKLAAVPGVAIGIVHGGKVVLEAGYGMKQINVKKSQPVTPKTLFMIGSVTKSLTTLMLARLVDEKKLDWSSKVVDLLPTFALGDPAITKQVTVQHTVCACTGMPRQDLEFLFEYDGWDAERRLASMATMKPTTGFGETFQYSNVMVATGGWVGAHVVNPKQKLDPAYAAAMKSYVLGPLGMTATTFDMKTALKGDHALPHKRAFGAEYQTTPVAYERAVDGVRPAGAAWSNVRDMTKFLLLELASGKLPNGKQLVSEANLKLRRAPQVKIDADSAYGLGFFVVNDHGVAMIEHGGNTLGFTTEMFFLPEHDIGVVILTNAGSANSYTGAVRRFIMETLFGGKAEAKENLTASLARREKSIAEERPRHAPPDEAWITPLLGTYTHPSLGTLTLKKAGAGYTLDTGEWTSAIDKHTDQDGTVYVSTSEPPYAGFDLRPGTKDGATTLVLDAGQQVYEFTRTK